jgi:hypothetical protein
VRARIAASVVLAAGLLLGTSGCAFFAPQSTLIEYDPSDGVGTIIGGVHIENALLLTQDGERASLLVNFINDDNKAVDMKVQYTDKNGKKTTTSYDVPAGGTKTYGAKGDQQIVLTNIGTKAGALLPVYFQHGSGEGDQLMVPVLDGTWSTYKGLLPSPKPTPTPTLSDLPVTTPTPAPTN